MLVADDALETRSIKAAASPINLTDCQRWGDHFTENDRIAKIANGNARDFHLGCIFDLGHRSAFAGGGLL